MQPRMNVRDDSPARPLVLLGLTAVFIVFLLLVSGGGGKGATPAKAPGRLPGALPLIPGAPLDGAVNSPISSAPPVTIVDDVRDMLNRLPLERNTPPGADPPKRPG